MRKFLFICFMVVSMPAYSITCINDYGGDNSCVNNKDTAGDCITLGYSASNVSGCVQYVRCPFNSEYKRCVLTSSGSSVDCAKVGFTATDKTSWCAPDKIIKCPADESLTLCDGVNLKIFDCAELGFTDADKSSWCIDIVKCPTDDRFSLCNVAGSPAEDVTEPDADPETCEGVSTGSEWTVYADSCFEKYKEPHASVETVTTPSGSTLTCQVCCKYYTTDALYQDYPNSTFKTGVCLEVDGCKSGFTMVDGKCVEDVQTCPEWKMVYDETTNVCECIFEDTSECTDKGLSCSYDSKIGCLVPVGCIEECDPTDSDFYCQYPETDWYGWNCPINIQYCDVDGYYTKDEIPSNAITYEKECMIRNETNKGVVSVIGSWECPSDYVLVEGAVEDDDYYCADSNNNCCLRKGAKYWDVDRYKQYLDCQSKCANSWECTTCGDASCGDGVYYDCLGCYDNCDTSYGPNKTAN